jgi:molecular chaperone GrpE
MYKNMTPADLHAIEPHPQDRNSLVSAWAGAGAPARQLTEQRERYIRLAADFENFRKRTARELERHATLGKEAFVRDLLPVIDNLGRALAVSPQTPDPLRHGIEVTLRQAIDLLRSHGFEPREDLGASFDPSYHEAVCTRATADRPHHSVLEVWQRGWMRGTVLFRPSQVVVNDLSGETQGHSVSGEDYGHAAQEPAGVVA